MRAALTETVGVRVVPFHRRISPANITDLGPLSKVDTRKIIEVRMKSREKNLKPACIPFTDDFIAYVYGMSKGRPNEIVMLCDIIFLEAQKRKLKEVDQKRAKEFFWDWDYVLNLSSLCLAAGP